jgi:coatomer subunit beta'
VDAWKDELKNRPKIASSIAHPGSNAELFTEDWEDALEREQQTRKSLLLSASINGSSPAMTTFASASSEGADDVLI